MFNGLDLLVSFVLIVTFIVVVRLGITLIKEYLEEDPWK